MKPIYAGLDGRTINFISAATLLFAALAATAAQAADDADREFFEKRIRPVLVERCYECHNSRDNAEGNLALDHRAAMLAGGDSGEAVVPGKPDESLLIQAIRHQTSDLRMPDGGPKLSPEVIADFVKWIASGAPDPRDKPPSAAELDAALSWDAIRERRKQWWSFQPMVQPPVPEGDGAWSKHPVDRFLEESWKSAAIEPAGPAERRTLLRRTTLALTGLPPTPEETEQFLQDESPQAYERVIDRLLASPRFGERWARHWMDWVRYAESHGSEGDPAIPHAWRYRDYLIRALNADIPYDQLVREHLAGDLLSEPRINAELQINESALGTAHYRMVQHGYAPTDALDEQVSFTDNQIDVIGKAFLGLTISCARCHHHKFDPISQQDFYALYGIMARCRPALITVDTPERRNHRRQELADLKPKIKQQLAAAWGKALEELPGKLKRPSAELKATLDEAAKDAAHPLHAWAALREKQSENFHAGWRQLNQAWSEAAARRSEQAASQYPLHWDLTGADYGAWFKHGNGLDESPSAAGEFHILPKGSQLVSNIYPAGVYSHLLSNKHNGVLTSPRFKIETDHISVRVAGGQNARVRLVVCNYPRTPGLLYRSYSPDRETLHWHHWNAEYWKGEWAHLEIATAEDLPVEIRPNEGRSWFGIAEVVGYDEQPPADSGAPLFSVLPGAEPQSPAELAKLYTQAARGCLKAWAGDADDGRSLESGGSERAMTNKQAEFLGALVRSGLLPNALEDLPELAPLAADYRKLEAEVPVPVRSPGVLEGTTFDQPLFVRGNHKQPGEPVARRFLEAIDATPYQTRGSGRLELAADIASAKNPLAARVIVNRLWHHLFGRGIVTTTDNFGHLGAQPSHPELLDYLASRFIEEGWSIKRTIRLMMTAKAYQLGSRTEPSTASAAAHASFAIRRLEAEELRDSILLVSGQLDETRFGPSVNGRSQRRSVYVRVQRNALDPFLAVFDAPEPHTTRGVRDATNVPAQSLALLNDPWVLDQARRWGERVARDASLADDAQRIERMFLVALGRRPTADEQEQCRQFLTAQDALREAAERQVRSIEAEIASRRRRIARLLAPARERLTAAREKAAPQLPAPRPLARWDFDDDLRDLAGDLHGVAHGNARLESGALVLDGASYVDTGPLPRPLQEKTLEAWVVLADLSQQGGGVMSVETLGGQVFDAIVFGERNPRQWLAGSDHFRRTQGLQGPEEQEAAVRPVHIVLVYETDGTIRSYRDGQPYGQPYHSSGLMTFAAGGSHVAFGMRHAPAGGNKMLKGRILQARLYDRALQPEEIAASAAESPVYISDVQVLDSLSDEQRAEHDRLSQELAELETRLKTYQPLNQWRPTPARRWQDLAHALFNLKEFLYVR